VSKKVLVKRTPLIINSLIAVAIIKSGILKATVSELVKKQGLPINCEFRNEDNVSCYT